jgi:hypothetical protein
VLAAVGYGAALHTRLCCRCHATSVRPRAQALFDPVVIEAEFVQQSRICPPQVVNRKRLQGQIFCLCPFDDCVSRPLNETAAEPWFILPGPALRENRATPGHGREEVLPDQHGWREKLRGRLD